MQANKAAFQIFSQDFPNLKLALEGKKVKKNEKFSGYEIDGLLVCIEPEIVILVESKTNLKSEDVDQVVKAADKLKTQCKDPRLTLSPEYVKVIEKSRVIKVLASPVVSEQVLSQIQSKHPEIWVISDSGASLTVVHQGEPHDNRIRAAATESLGDSGANAGQPPVNVIKSSEHFPALFLQWMEEQGKSFAAWTQVLQGQEPRPAEAKRGGGGGPGG